MKIVIAALGLSLLGWQVQAQTAPAPASAPAAAPPGAVAPAKSVAARRMTFKQRFAAANTTNDGRLTKAQASAARMTYTVRHFDDIDTGKKGYVTADEINNYAAAQRAAGKAAKAAKTPPKS